MKMWICSACYSKSYGHMSKPQNVRCPYCGAELPELKDGSRVEGK